MDITLEQLKQVSEVISDYDTDQTAREWMNKNKDILKLIWFYQTVCVPGSTEWNPQTVIEGILKHLQEQTQEESNSDG